MAGVAGGGRHGETDVELVTPEVVNLLDLRTWARATLMQISRVREAWIATCKSNDEDPDHNEDLAVDVHFLLIAAHQLVQARGRKLESRMPRLSTPLVKAITALRPIREHYEGHRDAFYDDVPLSKHGQALRTLNTDAHPWTVSGNVLPNPGRELNVAGVLPLDGLQAEVQAVHDAAHGALVEIHRAHLISLPERFVHE